MIPPDNRAHRQRGLTLIELMVAMLVGSLIVGLIFAIYVRMSTAYRAQAVVGELQQTLRAARHLVESDIRNAGFSIPNGFNTIAIDGSVDLLPAVDVVDAAGGETPDVLRVAYADGSAVSRVVAFPSATHVEVDDVDNFEVGDLAVLVNPLMVVNTAAGPDAALVATYEACVVQVTAVVVGAPNEIHFDSGGAPYNSDTNPHCAARPDGMGGTIDGVSDLTPDGETMMYRFVARSYRIDPNRKESSVFQMSPSGELIADDWVDMGIGFTDFQVATRYFEEGDATDSDADGDATRDWYSSDNQETPDTTLTRPLTAILTQVSVSFAVRTNESVDIVATAATPAFIDNSNPPNSVNHNRLGNSASITLSGVADASRPVEHRGNHIYRWSSSMVDVRNIGIGR